MTPQSEDAMPVEIYPAEDPATLTVDCQDVITADDIRFILERCLTAVRAHPAHFLIDCSNLLTLAPGALNVLAGSTDFLQHPNTRWLAFVTQSPLLKLSLQMLLGSADLRIFDDREDASRFLHALPD
jgi:hypothetical protein